MRIWIVVEKQFLVVGALVPVGAHDHPFARPDLTVFGLPSLDPLCCQQEVRILGCLLRTVDHVDRSHEALHVKAVGRAIFEILARDPVMRGVKMRARMLT